MTSGMIANLYPSGDSDKPEPALTVSNKRG
jgi:hypothetical protein